MQLMFCQLFVFQYDLKIYGIGLAAFCTNSIIFLLQNYFLRNLEIAQECHQVSFFDSNNLNGISGYLKLAIPCLLFIIIEWAAYDMTNVIAGIVDSKTLGCHVVYYQYLMVLATLPMGIGMAACTLVGNRIGEGDVLAAKTYYRHINIFSIIIWIVSMSIYFLCYKRVWSLFTTDADLSNIRDETVFFFLGTIAGDFWQVALGGTLRGLGLQGISSILYFITFFLIMLPLCWPFVFVVGNHVNYETGEKDVQGMGQRGIWLACSIALAIQVASQLGIIHIYANWKEIADESKERMILDAFAAKDPFDDNNVV